MSKKLLSLIIACGIAGACHVAHATPFGTIDRGDISLEIEKAPTETTFTAVTNKVTVTGGRIASGLTVGTLSPRTTGASSIVDRFQTCFTALVPRGKNLQLNRVGGDASTDDADWLTVGLYDKGRQLDLSTAVPAKVAAPDLGENCTPISTDSLEIKLGDTGRVNPGMFTGTLQYVTIAY